MMLYCSSCQVLVKEGGRCPACGKRKLREAQAEDPVMLMTATETKCNQIAAALDEEQIPHEERVCGLEGIASAYAGKGGISNKNIFVPYGRLQEAIDLMQSIGVTHSEVTAPDGKETAEMSPRKRFFWRAVSVVLFILLIWAVVSITDTAAEWLKSLLYS
ncbi:hypothetical protein [Anaeromassilibacillus senegalensis]|uniref:hypothetical protein n=1 Tax=Anaeromassilibacillus senegalensis TaxID=1673717 RepID=UPI00067FC916|nr:hypothetical protein [Anaeromassilibacillus senegalensis]